ncbi:tryptophan halogenase family protein [Pseudocolwellia agarivorans]|uniref:tryptophan halogenase family protein n=1 Tax=Pseudocolwellia agarivorans TaxID=1911682 RepID=UPI003F883BEB
MNSEKQNAESQNINNKPLHLVILGGGTAGWMAANLFAKKWSAHNIKITLVESPDIGIIGVGEGSTPSLKRFFEMIEVDESQWMPRCNATYKVNIRFDGWSPASGVNSYSHPFFSQVDTFTAKSFTVNCQTRRLGLDTHTQPEDFILNGLLAKQGKSPVAPDNFPFQMEYGYHFDSHLLGKFLAECAVARGVNHLKENVMAVEQHVNGDIAALKTKSGNTIAGDFFIDCSGFAAVLMQKTLGVKFNSYKDNLFNDSAIVMPTPISESIPVETVSTALSAGWCWKIPLQNRFGNGYVYSSDFISTDAAETELRRHLNCLDSSEQARHLKMKVGRLETHWANNCIGLGLSQGFIEPLEATALHLVQISLEFFMERFEQGGFSNKNRDEFNTKLAKRFDGVRDYIVAHYKLNTRTDSDYWRANRDNTNISDSLYQVLDVWYKCEDLTKEIESQQIGSYFDAMSWHCLLAGYGVFPPLAKNQPNKGDLYKEKKVQQFLHGCALNFG